ncbi:hypothetical protein HA41_09125 [Pantoea conspicua]|uniref:Uncharacterized protein n=1 Tax=Pantoea conspicua TaxID=472705 RepID=A0A1X1BWZ9_9GAMM|nr:hypothetical protein [Pantoea conspicua]ORM53241.1 hypothetical protein HA41_09125 [Pantoea conspicua]
MHKTYNIQGATTFVDQLLYRMQAIADPKTEVLSGYPANCSAWLTIYYHRKTDKWSFEWYDRAGCRRPVGLGSPADCLMREVSDRGASQQEHLQARGFLAELGFFEA